MGLWPWGWGSGTGARAGATGGGGRRVGDTSGRDRRPGTPGPGRRRVVRAVPARPPDRTAVGTVRARAGVGHGPGPSGAGPARTARRRGRDRRPSRPPRQRHRAAAGPASLGRLHRRRPPGRAVRRGLADRRHGHPACVDRGRRRHRAHAARRLAGRDRPDRLEPQPALLAGVAGHRIDRRAGGDVERLRARRSARQRLVREQDGDGPGRVAAHGHRARRVRQSGGRPVRRRHRPGPSRSSAWPATRP